MRNKLLYTLLILIAFFVGAASNYFLFNHYPPTAETINRVINEIKVEETVIEEAIERIYDAVVVVESIRSNMKIGSGTGFVYKTDKDRGYIITNHHVIADGTHVTVVCANGERIEATILGSDLYADIAVLGIPQEHVVKVAEIGKSMNLRVGNTVFAIGAPVGAEFSGTVTRGIVSSKERIITVSVGGTSTNDWLMKVIQTDAAINPGNSGGPLVNMAGEVIGINSLKLVREYTEGIGFAIPIEDAMEYIERLEKGEVILRPMLGVQLLDVTEKYALFYNNILIDEEIKTGAVIQSVIKDSPAFKAGLKKGDVILKIGNKTIKNKAELRYELYKYEVDNKIKITYYRDNQTSEIEVTLVRMEE
jgi:serine protease Do